MAVFSNASAQVFEYGTSNTSEGGGVFSLLNNGTTTVNLEPKMDLRLAAVAGNTVQVWVNSTNFNASNPLSGNWTAWGTASPTPAGTSTWTLAQWSGSTVALAPGQRVGILVRTVLAQGTRYQNPGPSSPQPMSGAASNVVVEFHNGLAGGTGLPTSVFGSPRGLNVRLYASAASSDSSSTFTVNNGVTTGATERGVAFDLVNNSTATVTLPGTFRLPIATTANVT